MISQGVLGSLVCIIGRYQTYVQVWIALWGKSTDDLVTRCACPRGSPPRTTASTACATRAPSRRPRPPPPRASAAATPRGERTPRRHALAGLGGGSQTLQGSSRRSKRAGGWFGHGWVVPYVASRVCERVCFQGASLGVLPSQSKRVCHWVEDSPVPPGGAFRSQSWDHVFRLAARHSDPPQLCCLQSANKDPAQMP